MDAVAGLSTTQRSPAEFGLARRLAAEAIGTAALLAAVVGSGIMGERLSGGSDGLALLANSIATGAALFVLITLFAPVSGAHFNPAVTLVALLRKQSNARVAGLMVAAQVAGAVLGVILAHAMFAEPLAQTSEKLRAGGAQALSEAVATFGLVTTILFAQRFAAPLIPGLVAAYITSAYWFTASTSFANPAVTLARCLTDSFAGIAPASAPAFIAAQLAGALAAHAFAAWLLPEDRS